MTPSKLKAAILAAWPESHFFDRATMRFWGDTMANFGCRDAGDAWELYRKRPITDGIAHSHFFDKKTLREVYR